MASPRWLGSGASQTLCALATVVLLTVLFTWGIPSVVRAETGTTAGPANRLSGWLLKLLVQIKSPWFWFGIFAQFLFFMRFVVQWIVSERRRRSTVPVAFWYLSIAGGLSLLVYACRQADLVIMLGQMLSCTIYIRNLMLIHAFEHRRERAGLPTRTPQ